jgi:hypothetical protein
MLRRRAPDAAGAQLDAVFGDSDATAEIFTAWHYARYVESLAAAGKAVYPLPMYVNAALNRPNKAPGKYPSGGPLPHLLDVWKIGAPSVDLLHRTSIVRIFRISPHATGVLTIRCSSQRATTRAAAKCRRTRSMHSASLMQWVAVLHRVGG